MVFQNIVMGIFERNRVEVKKAEENYMLCYENSFFFPSSSSMALQSIANLRLLNGFFPVNSVFYLSFPICNFACVNIYLYAAPLSVFWSYSLSTSLGILLNFISGNAD